MNRIILFILSLLFIPLGARADNTNYGTVQCKFIKNYDGDTITVNIPGYPAIIGKKISIRVNGIDTPELRDNRPDVKQLARTAKRLTENICKRASVLELRNMTRGKYFRIVADVYADGKSLASILIKNGLAKEYDGTGKRPKW